MYLTFIFQDYLIWSRVSVSQTEGPESTYGESQKDYVFHTV